MAEIVTTDLEALHTLAVDLERRIDALRAAPPTAQPLLTLDQAAERLAVGRTTVQDMVDRGELPVVAVTGRAIRIDPADLDALIKARRIRRG